jgi:hypothetical protein
MATGRKTVTVGQVIDPTTWGNPLWDQSVQTFTSAADRTSQFAAPKQGAVTWLEDVKRLEVYNGTAWVPVHTVSANVAVATFGVTTSEAAAATLALGAGTWDLLGSAFADWSTTGPPRYFIRLRDPAAVLLDEKQLYSTALGGSLPVMVQSSNLVLASPGSVTMTVQATGAVSGSVAVAAVKLRAVQTG